MNRSQRSGVSDYPWHLGLQLRGLWECKVWNNAMLGINGRMMVNNGSVMG